MNTKLLDRLSVITKEEQELLAGSANVDRSLYYKDDQQFSGRNEIDASLLLEKGKLIDVRPHTRFVHFPEHRHNFVEFVYLCSGQMTHIIDGQELVLKEGDLLFMNQHARQEILPAAKEDIAVNFIILPPFFDGILRDIGSGSSQLRDFLISCLTEKDMGGNYLYFHASGLIPVQNLMENLILIMLEKPHGSRELSQQTMALLFLNLLSHAGEITMPASSFDQQLLMQLYAYIDAEYKNAALTEFSVRSGIDIYSLGRFIKKNCGCTFTDLLQEKRLKQACHLLTSTRLSAADIAFTIGYENVSYFYRLFKKTFGMSPREYRLNV